MQNTPKSFWKTDNKVRAANAPNCVSIGGPDQARKFRQACAFIMARTAGGTDTRVIILKGGWMTGQLFGTDTFQCPYANIAGAEVKFHLLTGSQGGRSRQPRLLA